jgi:molybdate transport system substrate-binding protein
MATRAVLQALSSVYRDRSDHGIEFEAVGGVEAARRVAAGEVFDVVVLASDAIEQLCLSGRLRTGTAVPVVASGIAVAVPKGSPRPAIDTEDAVRRTVLAARHPCYSTGPSGVALLKMFERWGILPSVRDRLVQAKPGVPVGTLVARGESDLGFQQFSEFLGVEGIDVVGPLPPTIQVTTIFSAAIGSDSLQPESAGDFLRFVTSPEMDDVKRSHGMEPVVSLTRGL